MTEGGTAERYSHWVALAVTLSAAKGAMLDMVPFTSFRVTRKRRSRASQYHPVLPDREDVTARAPPDVEHPTRTELQLDPVGPIVAPDAAQPCGGNRIDRGRGHRRHRAEGRAGGTLHHGPAGAVEVPYGAMPGGLVPAVSGSIRASAFWIAATRPT